MRFSWEWLQSLLETTASVEDVCDRLVQLGHEVEAVENTAAQFEHVVIGFIEKRIPHPDADKLGICTVHVGADAPLQIVCGAPNARDGLQVAVALEGAVLPGDFEIKRAKIRGVESCGMICSSKELGLGHEHDGIMELAYDVPHGTPFAEATGRNDLLIEIAVTPNRGDVLSVYGLARDLAASGLGTLKALPAPVVKAATLPVVPETKTAQAALFSLVEIQDVTNSQSPEWLQKRLLAAGMRPINALVDVTNYVAATYGQPLHVYDAKKLQGKALYVAESAGNETFLALDEKEYTTRCGALGIYDASGLIGLAGIMGGETTAVDEKTTHVYLEAAHFSRSAIARTGQALGIHSEARHRFERGVDPALTGSLGAWAAELVVTLCGGKIIGQQVAGSVPVETRQIIFDTTRCETFGGLAVPVEECTRILEALHFAVEQKGDTLVVTPPSFRTTMDTDADVIEEVLRMKGYDAIPALLPELPMRNIPRDAAQMLPHERLARRALAVLGFTEALNYSFMSDAHARLFTDHADNLVRIQNPIDEANMSTLRPSLLPGLLLAAKENQARGVQSVRLAEVGKVYGLDGTEKWMMAGVLSGMNHAPHWHETAKAYDVFDAKAALLESLSILGVRADRMQVSADAARWYHPGRSANVRLGKNVYGTFGEVHPETLKEMDIKGRAVVFEIDMAQAVQTPMKREAYQVSNYPATSRDFAFVVDMNVPAENVLQAFRAADKALVKNVQLFDVYQGSHLPEGKKSLAVRMDLQAMDRTLTDAEISAVCARAVKVVEEKMGGVLRSA